MLALSDVLMASERTTEQPSLVADPALLERWPVKPTARRRFSSEARLTSYLEVYVNSTTRMETVQVRATVNRIGNTARQEIPTRMVVGEARRVGYITELPRGLREGQHVLSIEARAGKRTAMRQVVFTVGL